MSTELELIQALKDHIKTKDDLIANLKEEIARLKIAPLFYPPITPGIPSPTPDTYPYPGVPYIPPMNPIMPFNPLSPPWVITSTDSSKIDLTKDVSGTTMDSSLADYIARNTRNESLNHTTGIDWEATLKQASK